jgi:hypothetical protein
MKSLIVVVGLLFGSLGQMPVPGQVSEDALKLVKPDPIKIPEVDELGALISPGLPEVIVTVTTAGEMWASHAGTGETNWDTNMRCQASVKGAIHRYPGQAFSVICYPTASLYWRVNPQ